MREIIRFLTNVPVEVSLDQGRPKPVEGRYGPQMMYSLADGRVMYVPMIVADRIRELDIGAHEPFEICKAEIKEGNRRWINWQVRRSEGDAPAPDGTNTARPNGSPEHESGNTKENANGNSHPQSRLAPAPDGTLLPVPVTGTAVTTMETALNAAAEIVRRVQSRAALTNQELQFTSEDVRAIALTMFIQATREGVVRWDG